MTNDSNETAQKAKSAQTMQVLWSILMAVFAGIIAFRLYGWANGTDNLRGILSPLGMIFVGAGAILRPRNPGLSYVLTGIALILVISGLILMFVY
ncbi:MAG TPA: hypothetical protein VF692_13615 [Pyrinomonadaceae bacterium]